MIFQDIHSMDENGSWHSTFQNLNITSRESAGPQKIGKSAVNRIYNRYRDVVPYDHSLVRLRNSDTEYINANFVKVSSIKKEYILTQGPLPNTCQHFWEMIWEQNTYSVVMLNRVIEKKQKKCHQYWPLSGSLTMGDIKVTLKEEENFNEFVVRILEIEHLKEEETRSIRHFHYVAWPDFGVPGSPQAFLKYLLSVQEYQASIEDVGPPVIHCSAGIGRSGTFALIDAALAEIKRDNDMMDYDVKKILLEMRMYRAGLIQTTEQLRFSYIAILEGTNMVAPAAYGAAYWKMANKVEDESDEEVVERVDKRNVENDHEEDEEPKAKELRKEEPPPHATELSESETDEEDILNESDSETEVPVVSGKLEEDDQAASDVIIGKGKDFPEVDIAVTVTAPSSQSVSERNDEDEDREETSEYNQPEKTSEETNESFVEDKEKNSDHVVTDRETKTTTSTTKDASTNADENARDSRHKQFEMEDEDDDHIASKSSSGVQNRNESDASVQGVSSGRFPSSFNTGSSKEDISKNESDASVQGVSSGRFPSSFNTGGSKEDISSGSVEKVVNRWYLREEDSQETRGRQPRPKRSAMRTNSAEGKRKSVSFEEENGEAEQEMEGQATGNTDERETESSVLRRRQIEERKQNLSNKVDSIKKKMKENSDDCGSIFGKTMIGLVISVVVVGVAFFYYRYQS